MVFALRLTRSLVPLALALGSASACQTVDFGSETSSEESETGEQGMPYPMAVYNCDPGDLSACEADQKCTAIEFNGVQNLYECVSDNPTLMPFEVCTPSPSNGADDCPIGHLCVSEQEDASVGLCLPMCGEEGGCAGLCVGAPYTQVPICGRSCAPTALDCTASLACLTTGEDFSCRLPDLLDVGTQGDECDPVSNLGCAEGYACLQTILVNGCGTAGCCTSLCEVSAGDVGCESPHSCVPFAEGTPAPGLEDLGVCASPV